MAPDKLAIAQQNSDTAAGTLEAKVSEYERLVGKDKALEEANAIIGITEGAQSSEDPIAYANERMPEFIATLPEGEGRAKLEQMAQDGFQKEEMAELLGFAMAVNKQFSAPSQEAENPFAKINPKDFTPESVAKFQETGDFSVLEKAPDAEKAAVSEFCWAMANLSGAISICCSRPSLTSSAFLWTRRTAFPSYQFVTGVASF